MKPAFGREATRFIAAEMVVEAAGQPIAVPCLCEDIADRLEHPRDRFRVNDRHQGAVPRRFGVGDGIRGPGVVTAIANGRAAADGVAAYLRGARS